jgi:hypothetical protein
MEIGVWALQKESYFGMAYISQKKILYVMKIMKRSTFCS